MVRNAGGSRSSPCRRHGPRPASAVCRRPPSDTEPEHYGRDAPTDIGGPQNDAVDSQLQGQITILWQRVEDSQRRTDTLFGALASMDDRFAEARDEALARIQMQGSEAIEKAKEDIVSTAKHFMERTALALQRHWREERVRQHDESMVEYACDQAAARLADDLKQFECRLTDHVGEECGEMRAELDRLRSDAFPSVVPDDAMEIQILDKVAVQLQDFEAQISAQLACAQIRSEILGVPRDMDGMAESQQTHLHEEQPPEPQPQEEPEDDVTEITHSKPMPAPSREEPAGTGLAAARGRRTREQALALSVDAQLQATTVQLDSTDQQLQRMDARIQFASNRLQDQGLELQKRAEELQRQKDDLQCAETRLKTVTEEWQSQSQDLVVALQSQSELVQSQAESLQASDLAIEAHNSELSSHRNVLAQLKTVSRDLRLDIGREEAANEVARKAEASAQTRMHEDMKRLSSKLDNIATTLRGEAKVLRDEMSATVTTLRDKASQDIELLRSEVRGMAHSMSEMNDLSVRASADAQRGSQRQDKLESDFAALRDDAVNIARSTSAEAIREVEGRLSNTSCIARAESDRRQAALEAQLNCGLQSVQAEIQRWVNDGNGVAELQDHQTQFEESVGKLHVQLLSQCEKLEASLSALRAEALGEIEAERGSREGVAVGLQALQRDFEAVFKPILSESNVVNSNQDIEGQSVVQKLDHAFREWHAEMQQTRSRVDEALKGEEWCVETTQASLFVHQQKVDECLRAASWAHMEYEALTGELQEWMRKFRPELDQIEEEFLGRDPVHQGRSLREALRDVLGELGSWSKVLHMLLKQQAALPREMLQIEDQDGGAPRSE